MIKAHTFEFPPDRCLLGIRVTPRTGFVAPETSRIEAIIGGRNVPCPYTVVDKELGPIPPTAEARRGPSTVFARIRWAAEQASPVFRDQTHDETFLAPSWQDTNERRLLDAEEMAALLLAAFAAVGLEARPVGLIPPGREHPASVVVEVKADGAWALADGMRDLPLGAPEIVPEGYDLCRPRTP